MVNRYIASDEIEPPKDSDKPAIYGPVPSANTAIEDQDDYPYATYGNTPSVPTTNVKGFVPYRGNEQHGVRFTHDSKGPTPQISHYQAEQKAFETYTDPTITPRDIIPPNPIKTQVVDYPNPIYRRVSRASVFSLATDGVYHQLLPADPFRKRLLISVRTTGTTFTGLMCPDENPTDIMAMEFSGTVFMTLIDSSTTSAVYIKMTGGDGTARVSYWAEYVRYDGEPLLS